MTTTHKTTHNKTFFMTGTECAAFTIRNRGKIAVRLSGSDADKADAISEVVCKCLGARIGTGSILKWEEDPFKTARTEQQWIALLVWQCRNRMKVIHGVRKYWYDPDIVGAFKTDDEAVCDNPLELCLLEGIDRAGDADEGDKKHSNDESDAECEPDERPDEKSVPNDVYEKLYHRRKIIEYIVSEEDRRLGNHQFVPDYDDKVSYRAAAAALADIVKAYSISLRDLKVWMDCVLFKRDRSEVAEKFDVTRNNLDQIVFRINGKLKSYGPELYRKHFLRLFHSAAQ